jgi:hypothetical protein
VRCGSRRPIESTTCGPRTASLLRSSEGGPGTRGDRELQGTRRPRPGEPGGIRYLFECHPFSDASFADLPTALTLLRKPIPRRVQVATRRHALCYLEDGRPVQGIMTAGTLLSRRSVVIR